jgi:hypothetical protein
MRQNPMYRNLPAYESTDYFEWQETMLVTLGLSVLFLFGGTVVAALCTFLIGLAGAPGALLAPKDEDWHSGTSRVSNLALAVCVIGQSYIALAFCAFAISFTNAVLADRPELIRWILWLVAFIVCIEPCIYGLNDAANKNEKKTQDVAIALTTLISIIGFWVLFAFPQLAKFAWRWVPYVH